MDRLVWGNPSSSQVSVGSEVAARATRDTHAAIWRLIVRLFCTMLVFNAIRQGIYETGAVRWTAIGVGLIASVPVTTFAWSILRRFRDRYRIHRDRCIHCGYPLQGLRTVLCPECGKEPI